MLAILEGFDYYCYTPNSICARFETARAYVSYSERCQMAELIGNHRFGITLFAVGG